MERQELVELLRVLAKNTKGMKVGLLKGIADSIKAPELHQHLEFEDIDISELLQYIADMTE